MELASYNGDASVGILVDNELWLRMNVQCATNCYDHGRCGCCNNHISSKNSARFCYEPCRSNDWHSPLAVVCSSFLHFGEHKSQRFVSLVLSWPPNQTLRMRWLIWQVYRLIPSENQRAPLHLYLATSLEVGELSPLEALNSTDFTHFSYWLACISYLFTF